MSKSQLPAVSLEKVLLDLRRTMTEALKEEAKKAGQSLSHFEVLKFVAEAGDPTMKNLATHLGITAPSASALVESLVTKGLLSRIASPRDRRTVRISLTAKAARLLASIHKRKISIFTNLLKNLNPLEKKQLASLLAKCVRSPHSKK